MRLVVLGGTIFLGRHVADLALQAGHDVLLFHRGRHPWTGAPGAVRVPGDRNVPADLVMLAKVVAADGRADAVIDTSAYVPRHVATAARALGGVADRYVFVSTLSVYAAPFGPGGEDAERLPAPAAEVESVTGETYGPLKRACEDEADRALGERAVVVRPGLIVGPHDPTDRYTWWVRRASRGGEMLAPGDGSRLVQCVDVRDLSAFLLRVAERGAPGPCNVTGRPERFDRVVGTAIDAARAAGLATPTVRWVPEDVLAARGAQPWSEIPLWIGAEDQRTNISRAVSHGLALRDLAETARDTLAWDRGRDAAAPFRAGMTEEREAALLSR